MKIRLRHYSATHRWIWGSVLLMTGATILVQLLLPAQWQLHCRFHSMTGLPCPGCGASRCGELLMTGQLREAVAMQPMLVVFAILLLPLSTYSFPALLLNWPLPYVQSKSRNERFRLMAGLVILILANWAYLIFQHI